MKVEQRASGPWGILRGVRPGKIADRLLDEGAAKAEIIKILGEKYGIEKKKAQILTDISFYQRSYFQKFLPESGLEKTVSVYIGIPYCLSKCLYCSFPSAILPSKGDEPAVFFKSLKMDIEAAGRFILENHLKVQSIYIGGGTPTSLKREMFAALLNLTAKNFRQPETKEFTVEAGRPDSIDEEKAAAMYSFGVNRVSVNPQTFNKTTLALIGRKHTPDDIVTAFLKIRRIPVINMDVIAGLPGEGEKDMAHTMTQIEALSPENVTVHTLAVKRGSLLKNCLSQTDEPPNLELPAAETVRRMLDIAADSAAKMKLRPYYLYRQKYTAGNLENTGYAKEGAACLYNMQIIAERQTIIGIGPAAGTKAVNFSGKSLESCYNPKDILTYVKNLPHFLRKREELLARLYKEN